MGFDVVRGGEQEMEFHPQLVAVHPVAVLIVDFDPQGAASAGLGVNANELDTTVYDLLVALHPDVRSVIHPTPAPGLDIVPANIDLSAAEVQLVNE